MTPTFSLVQVRWVIGTQQSLPMEPSESKNQSVGVVVDDDEAAVDVV